jgi:cation diffusion facilitator family transporter
VHEGSKKAIVAAFFANLGIAVAKFVGFLITRSAGLLAEAGHSLADTGNQGLLLFGSKRASRSADRVHPFGYGPERYFWAFVVALVLFSMGGLFAIYEGIHKLSDPHTIDNAAVAFGILAFAIVLEGFSLYTAVTEANHTRPPKSSWVRYLRASKSPELPVVLLEDVAAETGLVIAFFGLTMAEITGNPRWDAVGSIAIGVLLVVVAGFLAVEMKGLLIGEAPADDVQQRLETAINGAPRVNGIIHFRAMHLGPEELLVAVKVDFDHDLGVAQLAQGIDDVEVAMRASSPGLAMTIYIEPDIRRAGSTPAAT